MVCWLSVLYYLDSADEVLETGSLGRDSLSSTNNWNFSTDQDRLELHCN